MYLKEVKTVCSASTPAASGANFGDFKVDCGACEFENMVNCDHVGE